MVGSCELERSLVSNKPDLPRHFLVSVIDTLFVERSEVNVESQRWAKSASALVLP